MSGNLPAWAVFLVALVGGGGIAAMGSVVVAYLRNRQVAETEERSVTIVEVEKAIPGLGEIIQQLRTQKAAQERKIERLERDNVTLTHRVADLERDLAIARGLT